jgi:protein-S-isoprenylcysteine O-methyltransferase Ste14
MRATNFEFRYRFFLIALIFGIGFSMSRFDPQISALKLARFIGHPGSLVFRCILAAGAFIVSAGAAIRTWATAYLQGSVVHDMALHSDRLVADGPYRYVRNPLYFGVILLACGLGLLVNIAGWIWLVVAITLFELRLISREEAALSQAQGESFRQFKQAVPRLIPALSPCLPSAGGTPHWGQALVAESFTWAFALALLLFALTLNTTVLFSVMFVPLGIYLIAHLWNSHRQQQISR